MKTGFIIVMLLALSAIFIGAEEVPSANDKFLIAKFDFDKEGPIFLSDSSGKGSSIIPGSNITRSAKGKNGGALSYIPRTSAEDSLSELNLGVQPKSGSFSLSAWIKMRSPSPTLTNDMYIITNQNFFLRYNVDIAERGFQFGIQTDKGWMQVITDPKIAYPEKNRWYFIQAGFDGEEIKLIINGKEAGKKDVLGNFNMPSSFTIGACAWNNNLSMEGNFLMDELCVYDAPIQETSSTQGVPNSTAQESK